MNNTTTEMISEVQNKTFARKAVQLVDGVDLNYEGFELNTVTPRNFVLSSSAAIQNKILFWFSSSFGDYVREPNKGGPLINAVGLTLTPDNADRLQSSISTFFSNTFGSEVTLIKALVEPNKSDRRWEITMIVRDNVRRELYDLALGVSV